MLFAKRAKSWRERTAAALVAAVLCVLAYATTPVFFGWGEWVEGVLNRPGWVLVFEPGAKHVPKERTGEIEGVLYQLTCGTADDIGSEALRLLATLRSQSGDHGLPAPLSCLVKFSISQREMEGGRRVDSLAPGVVLADAGVTNDRFAYDASNTFLGSRVLAAILAECVVILMVLLLFGSLAALRADLVRGARATRARVYLVLMPYILSTAIFLALRMVERVGMNPFSAMMAQGRSVMSMGADGLFSTLVYAPIVEEMLFRYAMFTVMSRWWTPLAAAVMTSAMFAIAHEQWEDPVRMLDLCASGMLFQWLYIRYRSVSLCITAHAATNAIVTLGHQIGRFF